MSNTFTLEWPRGSGTISSFPEIDRAEWTAEPEARSRLVKGQLPVLDALVRHLGLARRTRRPAAVNSMTKTECS